MCFHSNCEIPSICSAGLNCLLPFKTEFLHIAVLVITQQSSIGSTARRALAVLQQLHSPATPPSLRLLQLSWALKVLKKGPSTS